MGDYVADRKLVGEVTHFFPKISVAVIKLEADLKKGDRIEIETNQGSFQQNVESMQVEHKNIDGANAGDEVGMKVAEPVKPGNKVYRMEE